MDELPQLRQQRPMRGLAGVRHGILPSVVLAVLRQHPTHDHALQALLPSEGVVGAAKFTAHVAVYAPADVQIADGGVQYRHHVAVPTVALLDGRRVQEWQHIQQFKAAAHQA